MLATTEAETIILGSFLRIMVFPLTDLVNLLFLEPILLLEPELFLKVRDSKFRAQSFTEFFRLAWTLLC